MVFVININVTGIQWKIIQIFVFLKLFSQFIFDLQYIT